MTLQIDCRPTGRGTAATITGVIDENADLTVLTELSGHIEINLRGIRRVNSFGARTWMDAIREVSSRAHLVFIECSPPVIDQLNMIQGFLGHGDVKSFYAPMVCEHCESEALHLFDVAACRERDGGLPPVRCEECGLRMDLDDLEDQYTLFLREPTKVHG